jgi:cellulose synthase/poly-beta-1,6-N-acetylglucosamine synthase-like glycosyltransferase
MKISLLVPCYNEETLLRGCIESALAQRRPFDEIIFVDDCSKDATPEILTEYGDRIIAKRTPQNTGNKSHAQEYGLQFVTGDVMVTTDGDTVLHPDFVFEMEKDFQDPLVAAVSGYVVSKPYNWLTLCRAYEYSIGQNIHKLAQSYLNYIFVMPGAASAFRLSAFRTHINFDHDTITEDLDFTYKLHHKNLKIKLNRKAISYTVDPVSLHAYINQMRRWYGGGWQNLMKHYHIIKHPVRALEISLIYVEGVVFSALMFIILIVNPWITIKFLFTYLAISLFFGAFAAYKEKRWTLIFAPIPFTLLVYINAYIYLEQMVREVFLKKKNLVWFQPKRVSLD